MPPSKAGVIDCSAEVDEGVKKWSKVAIEEKRLHEAIDGLLVLEKKCRNGEDHESGQKVASCIVKLCYDLKDFEALKANLTLLSKRRGQLKQVIKAAVQTCMECMESLTEDQKALKIDLIEVLRTITEGKIFVENERARLTKQLAAIREADGEIKEAAEMMQEIQVETYGAMDKREKSEFILEQIRLCLDSFDNIRALILSDKISAKLLADPAFQDIKLRYHTLMIRYFTRKENFLAICRAYLEMFHTPIVQEKAEERDKYLKAAALFCALAPYDHDQSDLAHRIQENKFISDLPAFKKMLKSFTTVELIAWQPFEEAYRAEIDKMEIFFGEHTTEPLSRSSDDLMSSSSGETSLHALVWEALQKRVTEHNIRVVAQHYSRIQTSRLCELLHLAEHETEQYVSALVSSKTIYAKIDRSQRIISFQKSKQASEQLNEWSNDIGQLLQSLERVSHLIHRENMVHKMSE